MSYQVGSVHVLPGEIPKILSHARAKEDPEEQQKSWKTVSMTTLLSRVLGDSRSPPFLSRPGS